MKKIIVGDKIEIEFKPGIKSILYVQGKTEDEILAIGPQSVFGSTSRYPRPTIVLAVSRTYQGVKLVTGDRVVVVTKDGIPIKLYISQFLDSDAFVLSLKNNSSSTTLRWLFDLMKNHI